MCHGLADLGCLVKNKSKSHFNILVTFFPSPHLRNHFLRCPRTKIYFVFGSWDGGFCNTQTSCCWAAVALHVEIVIVLKMTSVYWSKIIFLPLVYLLSATMKQHRLGLAMSGSSQFGIFWTISLDSILWTTYLSQTLPGRSILHVRSSAFQFLE